MVGGGEGGREEEGCRDQYQEPLHPLLPGQLLASRGFKSISGSVFLLNNHPCSFFPVPEELPNGTPSGLFFTVEKNHQRPPSSFPEIDLDFGQTFFFKNVMKHFWSEIWAVKSEFLLFGRFIE